MKKRAVNPRSGLSGSFGGVFCVAEQALPVTLSVQCGIQVGACRFPTAFPRARIVIAEGVLARWVWFCLATAIEHYRDVAAPIGSMCANVEANCGHLGLLFRKYRERGRPTAIRRWLVANWW